MRKKALLVGALSSFTGPWISLETGDWIVESPYPGGRFNLEIEDIGLFRIDGTGLIVKGPARVRGIVIDGEVHLNARQLERAGAI